MGLNLANQIEAFLKGSATSSDPSTKLLLSKLLSEMSERLERGSPNSRDLFLSARDFLQRIRGQANADVRVDCLLTCAHFFFIHGEPLAALEPARDALRLARSLGNETFARRALCLLGMLYADIGDIASAIENYVASIELSRRLTDRWGECVAWLNLGVALQFTSQHSEAIACLKRALLVSEGDSGLRHCRAAAFTNLALSHFHTEEFDLGIAAARECEKLFAEPKTAVESLSYTMREQNFAQLLLAIGATRQARDHCQACRRFAIKAGTIRADISASMVEGLWEVMAGNAHKGIATLTDTLEKAKSISSMVPDSLTSLIRAHDALGQPELALQYLHQLQDHVRRIRGATAEKDVTTGFEDLFEARDRLEDREVLALEKREANLRAKIAERELVRSRFEMLERLAVTADLREDASGEHGYRVGRLAALLAEDMGWKPEACETLDLAARLHDIGKIGVPDRILLESTALKEAERKVMASHTVIGSELLSKSNVTEIRMAEEIARCHHEWWDGTGYPARLKGKRIPAGARITALADVFDAMTHGRPYEQIWSVEVALEKIAALSGTQFDPDLTERFIPLVKRLHEQQVDLDAYLGRAAKSSPFLQARSKIRQMLSQGRLEDGTSAPDPSSTLH